MRSGRRQRGPEGLLTQLAATLCQSLWRPKPISLLLRRYSCVTGLPRDFRPGMQGFFPMRFNASQPRPASRSALVHRRGGATIGIGGGLPSGVRCAPGRADLAPPFSTAGRSPCAAPGRCLRRHARPKGACRLSSTGPVLEVSAPKACPALLRARTPILARLPDHTPSIGSRRSLADQMPSAHHASAGQCVQGGSCHPVPASHRRAAVGQRRWPIRPCPGGASLMQRAKGGWVRGLDAATDPRRQFLRNRKRKMSSY